MHHRLAGLGDNSGDDGYRTVLELKGPAVQRDADAVVHQLVDRLSGDVVDAQDIGVLVAQRLDDRGERVEALIEDALLRPAFGYSDALRVEPANALRAVLRRRLGAHRLAERPGGAVSQLLAERNWHKR